MTTKAKFVDGMCGPRRIHVLGFLCVLGLTGCNAEKALDPFTDEEIAREHAFNVVCETIAADYRDGKTSKGELCDGYDAEGWPMQVSK